MEGYVSEDRWVDLSGLPKRGRAIDWTNSEGYIIPCKYGDILTNIRVVKYFRGTKGSKHSCLWITVDDYVTEPITVLSQSISSCRISHLFNNYSNQIDYQQRRWVDLSKLPRIQNGKHRDKIDWHKSVGYSVPFRYDKAQGEIQILEYCNDKVKIFIDKYMRDSDYVYTTQLYHCNLKMIVSNRIINERPDLLQYLKNKNDAYYYPVCSNKHITVICPYCGIEQPMIVSNLSRQGFSCKYCSDNISYPNKFLYALIKQLPVVGITREWYDPTWMVSESGGLYSFDVYFEYNNCKYVVEADGRLGHGNIDFKTYRTDEEGLQRDIKKEEIAKDHDIEVIRIDCYISDMNYIKTSVLRSKLGEMFDLHKIDWVRCAHFAVKNLVYESCRLWDEECMSIHDISIELGIAKNTARKYLKLGAKIGICKTYSISECRMRSSGKYIGCYKNNKMICTNVGVANICIEVFNTLNIRCLASCVSAVCNGKRGLYKGLDFKFISKEEYKQYKMINNNNEVVKEVV